MPLNNPATVDTDFDQTYVRYTVEGMAHFAKTGPKNTTCGECRWHILRHAAAGHRCLKYRRLMDRWGTTDIPRLTPACKYFERKKL